MRDVRVAVWQAEPVSGAVDRNLRRLGQTIDEARCNDVELLAAPEMALTGWHPEATQHATRLEGAVASSIGALAREHGLWLATSLLVEDEARFRNTFVLYSPDGTLVGHQHKMHLWGAEAETIAPATSTAPIKASWGIVGPMVCYDVEFPEVARALALRGAEILIAPSAFYSTNGWDVATRARALENGCWLLAPNQTGGDPAHPFNGQSRIVDPRGVVLEQVHGGGEGLVYATIEAGVIDAARRDAPFLRDRRLGVAGARGDTKASNA